MPTDQPCAHDLANRRMRIGLLLSLLAHAMILSIGFGLSGQHEGGAGPITVSLAPLPPASPGHEPAPAAAEALPSLPPTPLPQRTPGSGFRVVDPVPMAPPPVAPHAQARPAKRRRTPRPLPPPRKTPSTPVIVQDDNPDATFRVPLADERPEPVAPVPKVQKPEPLVAEAAPDPEEDAAELARVEQQRAAEEEALRLAQAQEAERQRLAEDERQRLAEDERVRAAERVQAQRLAKERALALQRQAQAEHEQARQREEMAARERQLAGEAEARRVQEEQLRQERDRQLRLAQDEARARELAAQRALAEEERRIAAAREAERQAAEQAAQRLAAEREQVARQRAEEVAREQARQLARQQEEERTRRQRAEQVAAQAVQEELARQQAIEQARRQAREAAEAERARQVAQGSGNGDLPGMAPGNGTGTGGALPRGTPGMGGRARELLRGIELPGAPPAALRPAQQMAEGRRRVVDTLERDVPLRLYVDSFRQKIERNAAQIRMQVAGGPGRADPLVSVALRSDGSVDDVTIVRSSGRADLDEAVRRIVRLNARYAAFPPNVAARFDVIEIRRIWLFAETLKLLEEVR